MLQWVLMISTMSIKVKLKNSKQLLQLGSISKHSKFCQARSKLVGLKISSKNQMFSVLLALKRLKRERKEQHLNQIQRQESLLKSQFNKNSNQFQYLSQLLKVSQMENLTKTISTSSLGLMLLSLVLISSMDLLFKMLKKYSLTAILAHIAQQMLPLKICRLLILN